LRLAKTSLVTRKEAGDRFSTHGSCTYDERGGSQLSATVILGPISNVFVYLVVCNDLTGTPRDAVRHIALLSTDQL